MKRNVPVVFQVLFGKCRLEKLGVLFAVQHLSDTEQATAPRGSRRAIAGMLVHFCNLSTQKAEAGGMLGVQGQHALQSQTLSQKKKNLRSGEMAYGLTERST